MAAAKKYGVEQIVAKLREHEKLPGAVVLEHRDDYWFSPLTAGPPAWQNCAKQGGITFCAPKYPVH